MKTPPSRKEPAVNTLRRIDAYWNKPEHAAYLFIAPVMIILFVFSIVPLISSFILSGTDLSLFLTELNWVGLENFKKAFSDERFLNSLLVSFKFALGAVPLRLLVSILIALFFSRNNFFNKAMRSIYFLPVVCSSTVIGIMWKLTLNRYVGLIPYWLTKYFGVPAFDIFHDTSLALPAIGFMTIWGSFGMTAIIFLAAIKAVPYDLYESAELDGAKKIRQFFSITLPDIMPTFWFLLITNVIGSMQVFDLVYVVTNGGPQYSTETTVAYMFYAAFTKYKLGYTSAIAVIFFIIIMSLTMIMYFIMLRQEDK
jgi:multiple sugar transport system permease protein